MTRAERERRLLLIRQTLVDLHNFGVTSLFWRIPFRTKPLKLIELSISRIDALIRSERAELGEPWP